MNAEQPTIPRIWVFVEQQEHQVHPVSWELLGAAKRLSADLPGSVVEAVLLGHQVADLAPQAFSMAQRAST